MRNCKGLSILLCFLLVFFAMPFPAVAEEAEAMPVSEASEWSFSAFGSNTSVEKNPDPMINSDGSVKIVANGGKIASNEQGISFYYREVPSDANFEIKAKAEVLNFKGDDKQVSFGLMLMDQIGQHRNSEKHNSNYIAVGALDTIIKAFYMQESLTKTDMLSQTPSQGDIFELSIKKSGDNYVLTCNGTTETFTLPGLFSDTIYVGIYAARNAEIKFSDLNFTLDTKDIVDLSVDLSGMKTSYLVDEPLNLKGLKVTAHYSDGTSEELTEEDYIVTGFDSSTPGTNTICINVGEISKTIDLEILPLTCTKLTVKYLPAKTDYYLGDSFNPEGLKVIAEYNDGYKVTELTEDKYALYIAGKAAEDYVFSKAGTQKVEVISRENPSVKTGFEVNISDASIESLEIFRKPEKTAYFIGDEPDLTGLVVYARYSDGSKVRLDKSEYEVNGFDSSAPGEKEITVYHKGKTVAFSVVVKEKEVMGIEVTKYPKTTYYIGETFNAEGLEVSKVYDNGDREPLTDFSVDASAFDGSTPGVYDVIISADGFDPITLKVTLREKTEYEWKAIRFGQSTSDSKNYVNFLDNGAVEIVALEGGGKIATDHDGITFYYTEIDAKDNFVLSADIKVKEYAKNPHDGQESFGIMARDAIGTPGDSSIFASNIAAIGGFSGGTKSPNGTQLFIRTGVSSPDGAGSKGIRRIMIKDEKPGPDNTYPAAEYRLTLAKTNSGFVGKLNDGEEVIFYEPDILNVQDSKIYVGFFAARLATIEVSNIELYVSSSETDAPRYIPPEAPVTPSLQILSLDKTSNVNYSLVVKPNVNGSITVKQGAEILVRDVTVNAGEKYSVDAVLEKNSENPFTVIFIPDDTQNLSSYEKIIKNFSVTMRTYNEGGNIYVSPNGTPYGDGTKDNPLDLDTAIAFVKEGQKIILMNGVYKRDSALVISRYNDGTAENRKYLVAEPGSRPVIDFDKKGQGVTLSGNYWYIEGIDFARSAPNYPGFIIGGNYNIVENCRFYENGDTGLQISRTDSSENIAEWPSYNKIINCESFDNRDPSENNADGFAAKLTCGVGNMFIGCVSHHNIDDGWDLYTKAGTGAIGPVIIDSCIAYENGTLTDGTVGKGDKNGFKLGGEGVPVQHIIKNSIAFNNGAVGFTSNSNPSVIAINNIAYNNAKGNLVFTSYSGIETHFVVDGFVSYNTEGAPRDSATGVPASDDNYLFDGTKSVNKSGEELTEKEFIEKLLELISKIKSIK
ncbi:bacterial Ig-like domain-containing protein [Thermoclostridium stercorarium]|uniref:bacterial Ig-like domain-containing protein n=1 Tax=Thermoclostridium stercorarium TaxID=1510 RepID=UPI002248C402|nr:bacterial Ig-like domain-containing protein [Thermoclostridium stercorarium]UZQ85791.1 bacterial Ig-like domain-containing protein [Thermoclostridium stercorarium]